jgi:hypothetical protein
MHIAKLISLVLLTVIVMRVTSWLLGWLLAKLLRRATWPVALASNLVGLALFAAFLWWNLMPGEPFDTGALVFGAIVFGVCFGADALWCPWWKRRRAAHLTGQLATKV